MDLQGIITKKKPASLIPCVVENAQSLVEFTILIPLLITTMLIMFDVGHIIFSTIALREAVEEGVRYASYMPSDKTGIEKRVRETSQFPVNLKDPNNVTVIVTLAAEACEGYDITVQIKHQYEILTPFIGGIIGLEEEKYLPLTVQATGKILRPVCP